MKVVVNIARIIVGVLFVFSGLVKAIDPLGLSYKMQEFFEAWAADGHLVAVMNGLHDYAIIFSIIMIVLEVGVGVGILIGWQPRFVSWLLLIMSAFFLFLTAYVLFSGNVRECGCFGDCIPLSPLQTFIKDVILLLLVILIFLKREYVKPVFKNVHLIGTMFISIMVTSLLQSHALEHLPLIDCLPYKVGNNILELRKMPADATFDKFAYSFVYKKGIEEKTFGVNSLPDSTWQFVQQNQTLIEKGNGKEPAINDFSLTDFSGNDSTEAILGQNGKYYLFFLKNMGEDKNHWSTQFTYLWQNVKLKNRKLYVVTADKENVDSFFNIKNHFNVPIFICDATAIKTAARCVPTLFLMNGPIVVGKWSWLDINEGLQQ
jgi:uncharacterized membrane protein YphA (DoxX/SURF4 family)